MNLSGILVIVPPEQIEAATSRLNTLPGVEVHHTDPASGRMVVVQEAESVDEEVAGLSRIKALPGVMLAELVYHYFEEAPPEWNAVPETLTAD
jgi:nitrate reductase NapD